MKTKSFQTYLEKRLDKNEIADIKQQAQREIKILESFQRMLADMTADYMKKNKIGFNELVRLLDISPSQVAKIQRGEANLRLSSLAHLFALMGKDPKDIF
ncbi:MAG TPA: helix-turn-helix domain-containing protein [Candidatus Babeliales bacterium]|nr:helix-turn-helix domain-containing protein [Candidatus Babeliales bacterium]